jgi:hypothetical protein
MSISVSETGLKALLFYNSKGTNTNFVPMYVHLRQMNEISALFLSYDVGKVFDDAIRSGIAIVQLRIQ